MSTANLDVPEDFNKDIFVCKDLDEVFESRTFRFIVIKALKSSGIFGEQLEGYLTTLDAFLRSEPVPDEKLLLLRELLKDEKVIQNAQTVFESIEFTGINQTARDLFRELFERGFFQENFTAHHLSLTIIGGIYAILGHDTLTRISDDEVALEDFGAAEMSHGTTYLARKYGIVKWNTGFCSKNTAGRRHFEGSGETSATVKVRFDEHGVSYPAAS